MLTIRRLRAACVALALFALHSAANAQDLEPRRWTHLPVGMNVIGAGYVYTQADILTDPLLDIRNVELTDQTAAVSYVRSFALAGKTARVDVMLPYRDARWTGELQGSFASAEREGLGDPRLRFSINLLGAPALAGKDYVAFRRDHAVHTTVGLALAMTLPLGSYDSSRLLNLGQNRFSFRPQLGVLHTRGPWSYELTGSLYLFTENKEFFGDNQLKRDPLYALQAHIVRSLDKGLWVSAGAGYGAGGESNVNSRSQGDRRSDLLAGVSFGFPLTKAQGIKFAYVSSRTQNDRNANLDSFLIGWSMRF